MAAGRGRGASGSEDSQALSAWEDRGLLRGGEIKPKAYEAQAIKGMGWENKLDSIKIHNV